MNPNHSYPNSTTYISQTLKIDQMSNWMKHHWIPRRPQQEWVILSTHTMCMNLEVINKFNDEIILVGAYRYLESHEINNEDFPIIFDYILTGHLTYRVGAFVYTFQHTEQKQIVELLVMSAYFIDNEQIVSLACVPESFLATWGSFEYVCQQLSRPEQKVIVIGGNQASFEPKVHWEDVVLPEELKHEILQDIEKFFERGVSVYKRLNLNPFRKILLAGVPGTGKTMLCNALAFWALQRHYQVIYVSGADQGGAHFYKVQQALLMAANARKPTLILLEELDAFLNSEQKALILNVLDGVEAFENDYGTLLVSTTNYPEAIDERVLKRPGRLDRIYIIPIVHDKKIAQQMLKHYLGDFWQPQHEQLAEQLVDYPGAFIREVSIFALTQVVEQDGEALPLALLEDSLKRLQSQIKARDLFVTERSNGQKV